MTGIFDLITKERELLHEMSPWPGLRNRSRLSEYARAELELIAEFDKARSATQSPSTIEIEGFVSRVGGRLFILRPCLSVDRGILCDGTSIRSLPTDYEFIRAKGRRIFPTRSRYASTDCLQVDEIERVHLHNISLEPEISMKDAEESLLEGYVDLPRQIKRNLLSSIISSPGELTRIGGLTATLLPIESDYSRAQYLLLEDLRKSIPRDLTSQYNLTVRIQGHGKFTIAPFPWSLHNTSDAAWDKERDPDLFSRISDGTLQEMTIGFSASSVAPKTLDEIWLRQADFPMLIDKEVTRGWAAVRFDLELARFFITVHTNYPFVDSRVDEDLARLVTPRLVRLRRDYDARGYGGLVNLDMSTGNPRSILSIAKTIARSDGADTVTEEHVGQAVALFVNAREDVFEAWSETERDFGFGRLSYRKEVQKTGKTGERIVAYLIEHPNTTRAEIRAQISRTQDRIFDQAFSDLLTRNLIYQSDIQDDRYSATNESL